MKDDGVHEFFVEHKQQIKNDGFTERLFAQLDFIPAPKPLVNRSGLIITGFSVIGLILFVLLGGYDVLIKGLDSMSSLSGGFQSIPPEVYVSMAFMICFLFLVVRFAVDED